MRNRSKQIIASCLICMFLTIAAHAQNLPTGAPDDVGLSSVRLKRISALMKEYVDQRKLAGIVAMVARRGKVAYRESYGMMDIEAQIPMQFDAIFRIASMTKPIVSVAAMMLYEEGRFQLDDPVSKFIPEFKGLQVYGAGTVEDHTYVALKRQMTIQDLFRHTSGLTYGFSNTPVDSMYLAVNIFDPQGNLSDMIKKLSNIPLLYQPGERWHYSASTDVLGYLIEVISGESLDEFLSHRIFEPLAMRDTGFYVLEDKIDRFTTAYGTSEDGLRVVDAPAASRFSRKPTFFSGGGGLVSTTLDYMRFAQMLLNNGALDGTRLLSPKTVQLMTINHVPVHALPIRFGVPSFEYFVRGYGFGLGVRVLQDIAESGNLGSKGTYGWAGMWCTYLWIDPEEELIGLLMAQFQRPAYYPFDKEFHTLMYQSIIE